MLFFFLISYLYFKKILYNDFIMHKRLYNAIFHNLPRKPKIYFKKLYISWGTSDKLRHNWALKYLNVSQLKYNPCHLLLWSLSALEESFVSVLVVSAVAWWVVWFGLGDILATLSTQCFVSLIKDFNYRNTSFISQTIWLALKASFSLIKLNIY